MDSVKGDQVVLDVKPVRTLSPMFPSSLGLSSSSPPGSFPFVYVSPSDPSFPSQPFPSNFPSFPIPKSSFPNDPHPSPKSTTTNANGSLYPFFNTPPTSIIPLDDDDDDGDDEQPLFRSRMSASGRKLKQSVHLSGYRVGSSGKQGSSSGKVKKTQQQLQRKKPPRKIYGSDLSLILSGSQDPRESVEVVLMTYDALRRRLLQLDDGKDGKDANRRPDLTAGTILMSNDLRANNGKRIGSVPGVEVGDIFYFRMELCVVGLHAPIMGGIDYMTASFNSGEDTIAVGIVSAGGYENEDGDVDVLVYSGQGGNSNIDQKLERGNLALERSLHHGNVIRVIRSAKDYTCLTGRIYIYDGLYKIRESWVEKGKTGFNVFKYKLFREPGQPSGIAVWKMTQKWKENPTSRGKVILPDISSGVENTPVCLVNEVDDEKGPSHFTYVTRVKYLRPLSSMKPLEGCRCLSVCLPGDDTCACARINGGDLPYSSTGFLVSRKPIVYECGTSCLCSSNCRNRLTQKGVRLRFEVFKTRDRGWSLRSWDPIRAGSFICEYTGEVIDKSKLDDDGGEDDDYIFETTVADDKTLKWNYGPELLGETSADNSSETFGPFPIIISAKNTGNISRFMNHSCSPNVFWQPVQHDHGDNGYPHIMFFAIKHIPPMTELTFDYGLSGGVGCRKLKKCLCESPKCRGIFG